MKKLKMSDLKQKNVKELVKLKKSLKQELFNLRMKNSSGWLKQTHTIVFTKRDVARVNTALTHKLKLQKWQW